jgi:hypothetical protein
MGAVTVSIATHTAQTASGFEATADFLSSVTAQTNILSIIAFSIAGAHAWRRGGRAAGRAGGRGQDVHARRAARIALMRGVNVATLVGMSLLFLGIYGPVVITDPAQLNPTSVLLHVVIPALAVIEWIVFPPQHRTAIRGVFLVMVFPVLWFIFTNVRGAFTGRYVYEFLDPSGPSGLQGPAAMTVLILASFFLVGVVVFVTQRARRVRAPTIY